MNTRLLLLALCLLIPPLVSQGAVLRDLEYALVNGISLRLDLYGPDEPPSEPLPLVVWIHGGAWRSGSKDRTNAPRLLGDAYLVASIDYRLSSQVVFPAQIHDCKAAIRWLRAHAAEFGIDPDRIGVWGSSAGGHLAALLGSSGNLPELEGHVGDHPEVSSAVQAVCDYYGPSDLWTIAVQSGARTQSENETPEALLLGGPVRELRELARLASPIAHVDREDPPFLIVHGDADSTVPYLQSVALHQALAEAGADASLLLVGGAGHGGFPPEVGLYVKAFFDRTLRAATPSRS